MLYSIHSILELAVQTASAQTPQEGELAMQTPEGGELVAQPPEGGELPFGTNTSKFAYISQTAFNKFFGDHEGGLQVLKLTCVPDNTIRYVAVAGPCECADENAIYLPYSIYQELTTICATPRCTMTTVYELEKATKIVLKPLDNAIYHSEMRDLLEEAMMDFPLLQKHTQFTIYIEKLGDYPVDIWVEDCEPAELVQLGGEVIVDFAEPLEEVAEWEAPAPVPIATFEPAPVPSFAPTGGMTFPLNESFAAAATMPVEPPRLPTADEKERMRAARLARYNGTKAP